jgi:pre-mRNA cleavage complex 2 protein Pcf11
MDEMLKTWKEPVPGSMDTRPVFPPDVTRPIENALIKAKTSYLQTQQEWMRSQHDPMNRGRPGVSPAPYRETATPPNAYPQAYSQPPAPYRETATPPNAYPQAYPQPPAMSSGYQLNTSNYAPPQQFLPTPGQQYTNNPVSCRTLF